MKNLKLFVGIVLSFVACLISGCSTFCDSDRNEKALQGFALVQQINGDSGKSVNESVVNRNLFCKVSIIVFEISKNGNREVLMTPIVTTIWDKEAGIKFLGKTFGTGKNMFQGNSFDILISTKSDKNENVRESYPWGNIYSVVSPSNENGRFNGHFIFDYSGKIELNKPFEIFNYLPEGWDEEIFIKAENVKFK